MWWPSEDFGVTRYYLILAFTSGLLIFTWWYSQLEQRYREKAEANQIDRLERELEQRGRELDALRENNLELSKVLHKDNKLIPAMQQAVRELSAGMPDEPQATELLSGIRALSGEREELLAEYERLDRSVKRTGVFSVDAMLRYMARLAAEQGTELRVSVLGSVKFLVKHEIGEEELTTLLADLLENALHAVEEAERKAVFLSIGIVDGHYVLGVTDSGAAFHLETLAHLGIDRSTTRAQAGGSGIGLMTTVELLRKHDASFLLDETIGIAPYTKQISVAFDGLGTTRIVSRRGEVLALSAQRPDIRFSETRER